MRVGPMRHRLEFQSFTTVKGDTGEEEQSWAKDFLIWGRIDPMTTKESLEDDRIRNVTKHMVMVRYRSDITETQRIKFRGRFFRIEGIRNPMELNKFLKIEAMEIPEDET